MKRIWIELLFAGVMALELIAASALDRQTVHLFVAYLAITLAMVSLAFGSGPDRLKKAIAVGVAFSFLLLAGVLIVAAHTVSVHAVGR